MFSFRSLPLLRAKNPMLPSSCSVSCKPHPSSVSNLSNLKIMATILEITPVTLEKISFRMANHRLLASSFRMANRRLLASTLFADVVKLDSQPNK